MKRMCSTLIYFIICCGLVWLSGCQTEANIDTEQVDLSTDEKVPEPNLEPKITFQKKGHDFGTVPPNKLHKGEIRFTNSGEETLVITKVSKCCGVVAELKGGEKKTILTENGKPNIVTEFQPGESGAINLEWRSGSQPMPFARDLVVHSNDKTNPSTSLKIKAKVELKVSWEPKRLKLLFDEENAGCDNIIIKCVDGRPFSITSFKSTGDSITAEFDPSVKATKFVLEPEVDMDRLYKNQKGRITIGLTHPDGPAVVLIFDVLPEYTLDPPLLIFFYAEPGKPIIKKLSILSNYEKSFDIDSIISKTDKVGIEILNKKQITNGYQLELSLLPPEFDGKMKFLDQFELILDNGDKLPIRCNGWYKKDKPSTTAIKYK